jgi:hypothetical protein
MEEVHVNGLDDAGAMLALKERVLAAAAATPSATRGQARRVTYGILALSVAAGLAVFELLGGLAHARDRPLLLTGRLADGWVLASVAVTWLTVQRASAHLREGGLLALLCAATPMALLAWMERFHAGYTDAAAAADWPCFVATLAGAATPLAGFLWARRGAEPRMPGILGAAVGLSCACWSALLVLLACPHTATGHALAGHVAPLVATTVVGAIVGARVLRMRRSRR